MFSKPFEIVIKELCEEILSETNPEILPDRIINHIQNVFPVEWSTLWVTEWKDAKGSKRLKLAAASGKAKALLIAENGGPAIYDFGEGLTGQIAKTKKTINRKDSKEVAEPPSVYKYDQVMYGRKRSGDLCRCVLGVPLLLKSSESNIQGNKSRVIGVLKLENKIPTGERDKNYFTDYDAKLLEGYAAVIAVALEKAQMRVDSIRIGQGLLDISESLLKKLGEKPDLQEIIERTAKVISAEACALWLREGTALHLVAANGYPHNIENITPYNIEFDKRNHEKMGLTVFVANNKKSLNLKSADDIKCHKAWTGSNDQRMWGKNKGEACYSLLAIPLIDDETQNVRGVFKIENKCPTIFQLETYFTSEDEKLLTTLGNSISLSLINAERFERLKRLENLVSKIRILNNIEEALFFISTGLTHEDGLKYNRAIIFLREKKDKKDNLVCKFALGPLNHYEWKEQVEYSIHNKLFALKENDFEKHLHYFRENKQIFYEKLIMKENVGKSISCDDLNQTLIHHAREKKSSLKYLSGDLKPTDELYGLAHGDFVIIPMLVNGDLLGVIYADNRFTGTPINRFELELLDIFSGMASNMIEASKVPDKLREEERKAWQRFSLPAAHRLGTETNIIGGEIDLLCKPQLSVLKELIPKRSHNMVEKINESLSVIERSLLRLRQATRDYQQLTHMPENAVEIDLYKLINDVVTMTISTKKNIYVDVVTKGIKSFANIVARKEGLIYVFEELLLNSLKEFEQQKTNKKEIKIELWLKEKEITCRISDTGKGIPKLVAPKLFNEPVRGRKGGTGLGILLIKRIINDNGGSIVLSKEKPRNYCGASFLIKLPRYI